MKKFLGFVLMAAFVGCGNDMKSGGVANVFEPTQVIGKGTQGYDDYFYPGGNCKSYQMDSRLKPGQVFVTVTQERLYENKGVLWSLTSRESIESVNAAQNSYVSTSQISASDGMSGWIKQEHQFEFFGNSYSENSKIVNVSPGLQKLIDEEIKQTTIGIWYFCGLQETTEPTQTVEFGQYTFVSGKKVSAFRAIDIRNGMIVCEKYTDEGLQNGESAPKLVETINLGLGTKTITYVKSPEIPNRSGTCATGSAEIEMTTELRDSKNQIVELFSERLQNILY